VKDINAKTNNAIVIELIISLPPCLNQILNIY
jgi:hypothetical protein